MNPVLGNVRQVVGGKIELRGNDVFADRPRVGEVAVQ
jgi:hypothetical protein